MTARKQPHSLDAEMALLGSILIDPEATAQWLASTEPDVFYNMANGIIMGHLKAMAAESVEPDAVTLSGRLTDAGQLDKVGGSGYLMTLFDAVPHAASWRHYADIVEQKHILRQVIKGATKLCSDVYEDGKEGPDGEIAIGADFVAQLVSDAQDYALGLAGTLADEGEGNRGSQALLGEVLNEVEAMQRGDIPDIFPTGFYDIDRCFSGGLRRRETTIIAGRPSMGKTSLCEAVVRNIALRTRPEARVLWFTLEVSARQTMANMLGEESGISQVAMKTGQLVDMEWKAMTKAMGQLSQAHITLNETAGLTPESMLAYAKAEKLANGLDVVVLDYIGRMESRGRTREEEVSRAAGGITRMARELDVAAICVSQLNRNSEGRPGRVPQLSDLRDSGDIEQVADQVILVHRPDYYDAKDEPGIAKAIIAKNKNGATGLTELLWDAETKRFENLTREPESDDPRIPE